MKTAFLWITEFNQKIIDISKIEEYRIGTDTFAVPMYNTMPGNDSLPGESKPYGGSKTIFASSRIIIFNGKELVGTKGHVSPDLDPLLSLSIEEMEHTTYKPMIDYLIEEHYRFCDIPTLLTSSSSLDRRFGKYLSDFS